MGGELSPLNKVCANDRVGFVTDRQPQLALRQLRTQMAKPATLIVLCAVAALLAIIAPFETGDRLNPPQLFAYWLILATGTYAAGFLVGATLQPKLAHTAVLLRVTLLGLATGLAITPVITSVNYITFTYWPSLAEWPFMLAQFFGIALIVSIIFETLDAQKQSSAPQPQAPALLARLPLEKRGSIVALSAQDHYTEVRTTKGEELVLIRLADAMKEAEPTPGLQVHRSHWVALAHVTAAQREGDRAILTLAHGAEIPVSRANVKAIKAAGLLPG